jgi:hypothetical protein
MTPLERDSRPGEEAYLAAGGPSAAAVAATGAEYR